MIWCSSSCHLSFHRDRSFIFLRLKSYLESFDLILEQLIQKFTKFVEVDLSRFVFLKDLKNFIMLIGEAGVYLTLNLVALQE